MIEKEKLVSSLPLAFAPQVELIESACTGGFLRPSRHYCGPRNGRVLLRRYPRRRFYYRRSLPCRRRPLRVSLFSPTALPTPLPPANTPERATTHTDLLLRARELSIPVRTIHNASIMNAIGACGLQLYNFGQTVSMVFFTDSWRPASFYDRVRENRDIGLHTLVLLDIKVKEQSLENMARGRKIYEPPR